MKYLLSLLLAFGILAGLGTASQTRAETPDLTGAAELRPLAQVGGTVSAIAFAADTAFVAQGPRLYRLTMTVTGQLQAAGVSPILGGAVEALLLSDQYAYVAAGYSGLYQLDISEPNAITISNHYDSPGFAAGLARQGDKLFLADWSGGLLTFDLQAGIAAPLAVYQPGPVLAVAALADELVVGLGFAGIQRLQMSDPLGPQVTAQAAVPAWDLFVAGATVLVDSGHGGGVQLFAGDSAGALLPLAELPTLTGVSAWGSLGDQVWVALVDGTLYGLDLTVPAQPELTSIAVQLGQIAALALWQDQLLLGSEEAGLLWLEQAQNGLAVPAEPWFLPAHVSAVARRGRQIWATSGGQGLLFMPGPRSMEPERLPLPGEATDLVLVGDYAYVAAGPAGLLTVDIHNPDAPGLAGQLSLDGDAMALSVTSHYLLVAAAEGGLYLLDISSPDQPVLLDHVQNEFAMLDVAVAGAHVYVANQHGVEIFWLTDPGELHHNYTVPTLGLAVGVAVADGWLYVADWQGVQMVDVHSLSHILMGKYLSLPGQVQAVTVQADQLYVALGEAGVALLDTQGLTVRGYYDSAGSAGAILPSGAEMYVADQQGGLLQLQQSDFQHRLYLPLIQGN